MLLGTVPPQADDVVFVVKPRMHSLRVSQVIRVFPATLRHRIFRRPEPEGLHPRREGGEDVKKAMTKTAEALYDDVIQTLLIKHGRDIVNTVRSIQR